MFASAPQQQSTGEILVASPWSNVLADVQSQISSGRARAARLEGPAPVPAARAVARAHSRLLVALEGRCRNRKQLTSELVEDAVQLIVAIAELGTTGGRSGEDERASLIDQLRRCLNAHEDSVLAGEVTYELRLEDGEAPAARARRAIADSSASGAISQTDLISLRIAAVDLAALLVRAAANLTIAASANAAPEPRSPALDKSLRAVAAEIDAGARAAERPADARGDVVAHHLAAGLRVPIASETMDQLAAAGVGATIDTAALDNTRDAWLRLATCEYLASSTLASQLEAPAHDPRFGSLADTAGNPTGTGTGAYVNINGTSFAAPMVAGAASLLRRVAPDAPISQIRLALERGARRADALLGQVRYGHLDVACSLAWLAARRHEVESFLLNAKQIDPPGYQAFERATQGCQRTPYWSVATLAVPKAELFDAREAGRSFATMQGLIDQLKLKSDPTSNSMRWQRSLLLGSGAEWNGGRAVFQIGRLFHPLEPPARQVFGMGFLALGCQPGYAITKLRVAFDNVIKPNRAWVLPTDNFAPTREIELAVAVAEPKYAALLGDRIKLSGEARCEYFGNVAS